MIKDYKVMLGNIDITSKVTNFVITNREIPRKDEDDLRIFEIVIYLSDLPLEIDDFVDMLVNSDYSLSIEINSQKIPIDNLIKEISVTPNGVTISIRKQ